MSKLRQQQSWQALWWKQFENTGILMQCVHRETEKTQQMQPCNNQHLALKWTAVTDEVHIWKFCHGVLQVMNIHNLSVEIFSCSIVMHVWEIKVCKEQPELSYTLKLKLQRWNSDRIIFNSKKTSLYCLPFAVIFLLLSLLPQCLQHCVL